MASLRNSSRRRGFTLVELLVAISVLAIVAVLGWRGLDSIVRARVALTSDLEQTRGMQLAFAQMQSDCAHIVIASNLGRRSVIDAEDGRITLIRTVFADDQPSRVQVVAYRLANGVLSRRESIATRDLKELDTMWLAINGDRDSNPAVVLQTGVESMTMRGWSGPDKTWAIPGPLAATTTGLEVSLQLDGRAHSMIKLFFLGAV